MSKELEDLCTDHANMRALLQILESELERYRAGQRADFELLESKVNEAVLFQNLVHHEKEDLVFKRLIQRDPDGAEEILGLLTDHARLALITRRLTSALSKVASGIQVPRGWIEQLLLDYVTTTRLHMDMEEKKFFPRAADNLTDGDWHEIDAITERIKGEFLQPFWRSLAMWVGKQEG